MITIKCNSILGVGSHEEQSKMPDIVVTYLGKSGSTFESTAQRTPVGLTVERWA